MQSQIEDYELLNTAIELYASVSPHVNSMRQRNPLLPADLHLASQFPLAPQQCTTSLLWKEYHITLLNPQPEQNRKQPAYKN